MNEATNNRGIINFGGQQQVTSSAVGDGATVYIGHSPRQEMPAPESRSTWGIGVVTILAIEAKAVLTELGLTDDEAKTRSQRFYTGR